MAKVLLSFGILNILGTSFEFVSFNLVFEYPTISEST